MDDDYRGSTIRDGMIHAPDSLPMSYVPSYPSYSPAPPPPTKPKPPTDPRPAALARRLKPPASRGHPKRLKPRSKTADLTSNSSASLMPEHASPPSSSSAASTTATLGQYLAAKKCTVEDIFEKYKQAKKQCVLQTALIERLYQEKRSLELVNRMLSAAQPAAAVASSAASASSAAAARSATH